MAEDVLNNIRAEAQRIEEDAIHSAKGHFEAAGTLRSVHLWLGVPAAVTSALSAVSVVTNYPALTAGLSVVAAILAALVTFLRPDAKASSHMSSGNRFLSIRSRARIFRTIDMLNSNDSKELATGVKALADDRDQLNETSEPIPRPAYERAKRGIDAGEAQHAVDAKKGRKASEKTEDKAVR